MAGMGTNVLTDRTITVGGELRQRVGCAGAGGSVKGKEDSMR